MNQPFHPGELRAQALVGVRAGAGAIYAAMPDQHRDFFARLPYVLAASVDAEGAPQASLFSGPAGFIDSPDPATLRIAAVTGLAPGSAIGLLGIDFSNRRRNRVNGVVTANQGGVVSVAVRQSFGNCPQHIRLRQVEAGPMRSDPAQRSEGLSEAARAMVAAGDTFFIASSGGAHGVDISHRGGPPGFVRIDGASLTVPDYQGNRYFNTLGNLLLDARAALLFIDFASGDVLELRGRVEIVWETQASAVGGVLARCWRFQVERSCLQRAALALRWRVIT